MKDEVDSIDATPSKRLYLSIIADYNLPLAICELVDNAIDQWTMKGREANANVDITLDYQQQRICIVDDAGGIAKDDLPVVVSPGQTGNVSSDAIIGMFGVGTKRAVVALAQQVTISTRHKDATHQISFDDNWIKQNDEWHLPVYQVDNIARGTTEIELVKLRRPILKETAAILAHQLGETYARFLSDRRFSMTVNGKKVRPQTFENWAYPPSYGPRKYVGTIVAHDGKTVAVEAVAGLTLESSPSGEYGVYFYCNNRLVAKNLKTVDVGFGSGLAGKPHADISLARIIVSLTGEARVMPWNSSKSNIDTSNEVFLALRTWLLSVVKDFASLSRRTSKFEGGWPDNVFKYITGAVEEVPVPDFPTANTSYLPPLPTIRPRYARAVHHKNAGLVKNKPWVRGLYESIIAVDFVLKQKLEQRNRIAVILLDSTLEIAFKEYLVNESGTYYSDKQLETIFRSRNSVHDEVKLTAKISPKLWRKVEFYYQHRNQLVHKRASVAISVKDVLDFRATVETCLRLLFKLKFPKGT